MVFLLFLSFLFGMHIFWFVLSFYALLSFCLLLFLQFKTLTLRFINSVLFMLCNLNWFFVCEEGYYISDIDHKPSSQRGILQAVYFIAIPV